MLLRLLLLMLVSSLTACMSPPPDQSESVKAPVVKPATKQPSLSGDHKKTEPLKPLTSKEATVILPAGWSVMDPKGILEKVEYKPEQGGVLFTLKPQSNLELFSAEDAEKRSYYKGRLNGSHLVALPPQQRSLLIIFTNRQNARSSVLLKYRQ
jgi:hypothetical protein